MPDAGLKWVGVAAAGLAAVTSGLWAWQSGGLSQASTAVHSIVSGSLAPAPIKGRGRAVTGDTIQIGGRIVRLAGIEAPELSQSCRDKRNRRWPCGTRARSVLNEMIRRNTLICTGVTQATGRAFLARCTADGVDLGGAVVAKGHAFAEEGLVFQTYAAAEAEARAAQIGVWQGDAERPAAFRAKRWETASKSAPDGCPIKGRVVRKAKIYVLPWALDYRQVRVHSRRGERWFCSETEATSAGFRPSTTG